MRRYLSYASVVVFLLGIPDQLQAQTSDASRAQSGDDAGGVRFLFEKPPSLRVGEKARIDFRLKVHGDHRSFAPDLRLEDRLALRRLRTGVEGHVLKVIQYEVEYDFRENEYPLRDAFVDVRAARALQVRGGKFKLPFSREELTGAMNLDFVFRSRAADQLSPGRAVGVMAHERVWGRRVEYDIGVFREDGENARSTELILSGASRLRDPDAPPGFPRARTWAARAVVTPVEDLDIGAAMTLGDVPEGRHGLRGRTATGRGFFAPLEVNGRRDRLGLEVAWERGPLALSGELMRVRDERRGQGDEGEDLPAVTARGWYVAGTWMAAGAKPGGAEPPPQRFGGIELASRYEALRFGSGPATDEASRSPRAAAIMPNADRAWTLGVNWYVNQFIRVQSNAIRERLEDTVRAPIPGEQVYWTGVLRFQFVL